ncbi:MAG: solute carrier family 23 protein [Clostridia bacterium]|nr:solute carrier family 23 protein [Clostridia bacterium]MDY2901687.1 solute carrier family 23 protein [Christensenellaceae bacterium]
MKLVYGIKDRPSFGKNLVFAFQQMIAIMAATLLVPIVVKQTTGLYCDPAAALFGAGAGTIVYLLFTRFRSPVFLGSSFTFLGALCTAAAQNYGYWGLIIGVAFAGLVYVVIALIIKLVGSGWIKKLLPHVIIGPVLAIIGLSLSGTAGDWMMYNGGSKYGLWYILVGLVTFVAIVLASVKGGKGIRLIPFIVGIGAGLVFAILLTCIGLAADYKAMQIVDFTPIKECFAPLKFQSFFDYPKFTFIEAIKQGATAELDGAAIGNLAVLFVPIAVVELAQHISDHENLSNIVEKDLLEDPGLHNTLLGDGIGSAVGAFFGGCANTTYGESISCVALSKNASTYTILTAAVMCMLVSFVSPFVAIINMIPKCVMGGACIAMYGFISVSGLQMLKDVDLGDHRNLYPVAAILVIGIGGVTLNFGTNSLTGKPLIQITALALAMAVGIIVNYITHSGKDNETDVEEEKPDSVVTD